MPYVVSVRSANPIKRQLSNLSHLLSDWLYHSVPQILRHNCVSESREMETIRGEERQVNISICLKLKEGNVSEQMNPIYRIFIIHVLLADVL